MILQENYVRERYVQAILMAENREVNHLKHENQISVYDVLPLNERNDLNFPRVVT